ncbi:protachykinin-1 isoform X2 [Microcaecilia unicolor]|uniref:Protachykinin-1 isoform X2 n=1 Tax=Microcaecilia unicolor TaxID=1415580 RepID=A0A6P7WXE8_9AMPH|nr:protachykinin-1 isoform X2 [Microcaecilia unicolor]
MGLESLGRTAPEAAPSDTWATAEAFSFGLSSLHLSSAPPCEDHHRSLLLQGFQKRKRRSTMKMLIALAVFVLVAAQVFAEEIGYSQESDWPYSDQIQDELQGPLFENFLQRIARKPRPDQFFGLMGKRNTGLGQISRRRHKTDSFFGLMGKRSLYSGSSERNTVQNYERRRK